MPKRRTCVKRLHTKPLALVVTVALLTALLTVMTPATAFAVGTVLFQNSFTNNTVDGTGTVTKPTPTSGTNVACLTAKGNSATLPLLSCVGATDLVGAGKLRLTNASTSEVGGVYGATSFPTSNGLDVTFNSYQWGGSSIGADGMAFVLAAVDPANSVAPTTIGPSGGSLGYSPAYSISGLPNAYLGVGLDVFGNFSNPTFQGTGCVDAPNIAGKAAGSVVVRGPGNVKVGYCGLTTTYDGTDASKTVLRADTRAASEVPVQVLINPTASPFTSATGVIVAAGTYKVVVKPVGQTTKTLTGALPAVATGLYPSSTWTTAAGIPKQLAFGFVGSTGGVTDVHEISDVKVLTFNPVPRLAVAGTSYSGTSIAAGDPVNYVITPSVLVGSDGASAISVTQTVPTGVVPVGAFGSGWVCGAPIARAITCTTSATSFTNGTTLPVINVVATVTASGMTSATIQNASISTASSSDANPATATIMTAGTVPPVPTAVSIDPTSGVIAGGAATIVQATTSNITPTAIEIGTVAEQRAGTSLVLLPCASGRAAGCFDNEGTTLYLQSMPARAAGAGTVIVTVVTLGVATGVSYVYVDQPAAPAAPTATAGISSATVSWVAPANNGSALTSYVVTPYLGTTAQTPQSFDTSTTTRTVIGLTAGSSYTFTVAAVNAIGTSTASAKSAAVVPYVLPGAPTISTAAAGDSRVTLTWNTPFTGYTPITGFMVTPYIANVPQSTQTFTGSGTTQTVTGLTAGTSYTFTVAAQNLAGTGPASVPSSAVIPNFDPSLTFTSVAAGEVGAPYTLALTKTGGTTPFVWSISAGTLPAGVTLTAATGQLSGTPTASGTFPLTIRLVDASGVAKTQAVTLAIAPAPAIVFTPAPGELTVDYSSQPTVTDGTGPYTWSISAGSLPPGVTLNTTTGLLSGMPTLAGSFIVTLRVTDAFSQVATTTPTLVIAALPTLTFPTPASGQVGVPYSTSLTVTGGLAPIVWSVSAGSLPAGLLLNTGTGLLSGTPTTVGSTNFTVRVIDVNGLIATKAVTLVVTTGPLVIVKTANASSVAPGDTVAFTIVITNTSTTAFASVDITDPFSGVLDDAVYNNDATASTGTIGYSAPNLNWTGGIAAGGTVTINYSVTVNNPDPGNRVLANTAVSSTLGTNCSAASVDPRCTATVTVAGLMIVKTADVATTTPGSTVTFTIKVTNTGQTAYAGAILADDLTGVLDDAVYNANATATSGNLSYTSPKLTWTGNLALGASATITYTVTVANPDGGNRSLTGTVVSSAAGSVCPSANPAASCTATVKVDVPALAITVVAGSGTTIPGATVDYILTIANTGETPYTATSVTTALAGALDDAVYNADAHASSGAPVFSSGPGTLVWTGDVGLGAVITITWSMTVRDPDPGNKILTAVASSAAAGSTCPSGGSNTECASAVPVKIPALTISKSANVTSTTPGSVVQYSISVTNTGQTAYVGATIGDVLTGVLDDATYNNNVATTAGAVSFTNPTVTWTGNLAIGATATITYSVTVRQPDPGNLSLVGTIASTTQGSNCAAGSLDARCTSTVDVLLPALTIVGITDVANTTPGSVVRYTITVTNTGQTAYSGTAINLGFTDVFDDANYNNDASTNSGSIVVNNQTGAAQWVLSLAVGQTAVGSLSFTVKNPDGGNKSLVATSWSDAAGSTCPSGSVGAACKTTVPVLVPGLVITKTADRSTVNPGGVINYTVAVANTGETTYPAAAFSDSLASVLTDAVYAGGATATTGTVTFSTPTLSWTGSLAPKASATISYSVTVRDPDPGDKHIENTVVSTSVANNCAADSTDARCTAVVDVLVPQLTIAKTASARTTIPGAVVGYSIVVTNTGATPYSGATFTDNLSGVLDDAVLIGDPVATPGTTAQVLGSVLTWTGDLAIGASANITYSVTVNAADGGDNLVTNAITSTTSGNNCASGSGDARCTVTVPVARLIIAKSPATVTTTTPGSVIALNGTFTNTGQVPYTGITISSPAADILDDVVANGDQHASSGILSVNNDAATWTGDIPVGGVITITGNVTVLNPDNGNKVITSPWASTAPGNNCPAGSTDTRCTVVITVLLPGLTITKTADTALYTVPGATVNYTITIHNTGQTIYTGAVVSDDLTDVLDDATFNIEDATANAGLLNLTSRVLNWTGDLAVGATSTVTYKVVVLSPDTGDKAMINQAVSTVPGSSCPPASGNLACRATIGVQTPALTIVKSSDIAAATLGSTVNYKVVVTNSGQTVYPAAAFTDSLAGVLDDATYNAGATTASKGTAGVTESVLSWSGALNPGDVATIIYTFTVTNPDPGDKVMKDTVVSGAAGNNCASGSTDTRCTSTVTVINTVALVVTSTANVATTAGGNVVDYSITVHNATTATLPAAFSESLSGVLDDATLSSGPTATGGVASFTDPNLAWSGDLPAGGTVTVSYSVTVNATIGVGDQILAAKVISVTSPGSNTCSATSFDTRCSTSVPVARLAISQWYTEATTTPGSVIHLNGSFINTGKVPYVGIVISSPSTDTTDDAVPSGDQVASSGSLVLSASAITWTGDIPVGATITITGTLTVKNPDTGNKSITGTLVSAAAGNNCTATAPTATCTVLLPVLVPSLTLTDTASQPTVAPGGKVTYTLTIANSGETSYTALTVTNSLSQVLPHATYNADAAPTLGVTYTSPTLTWTGDLAVGQMVTITYSVTTFDPPTGDKTMVNTVSSDAVGSTCTASSANAACRSTVGVLTPALTIVKKADVTNANLGTIVTYTITVSNTGQTDYPSAAFSDSLAGVVDNATYNVDAVTTGTGAIGYAAPMLTWSGALVVGASETITYSVTVTVGGDLSLTNIVTSATSGSNCPPAGTDTRCTAMVPITNSVSMAFTKTADVVSTVAGATVHYTVTATNSSGAALVGDFTDSLAGILDDATYNTDARLVGAGSIGYANPNLTWAGTVPNAETITITYSVTVHAAVTGDQLLDSHVVSTLPASSNNCLTGSTDPRCGTVVTISSLVIEWKYGQLETTPGSLIHVTSTFTNTGTTPYVGISVTSPTTDTFDDALPSGDQTVSSGSLTVSATAVIWTGDIPVGETITLSGDLIVLNPDPGNKKITGTAVSTAPGNNCLLDSGDSRCTSLVTVLLPGLTITKSANTTAIAPGGTVTHTITILNSGQTNYAAVTVTDTLTGLLDDAVYNTNATTDSGSVAYAAPTLTWSGSLLKTQTVVVTYTVTVKDPDPGDRTMVDSVASTAVGSSCLPAGGGAGCQTTILVLTPGLTIVKTANVSQANLGSTVTYTILISNTGQTTYPAATISDPLAGVVDDATYNNDAHSDIGTAAFADGAVIWTGVLPPGISTSVIYTVGVNSPAAGDRAMSNTVTSSSSGSNCAIASADTRCVATVSVINSAALTITQTTDVATSVGGGTVNYTIITVNSSPSAMTSATFTASLADVLDDANYMIDSASASIGAAVVTTAPLDGSNLTWSGSIPAGTTVVVGYSVTVHAAITGDQVLSSKVTSPTQPASNTCAATSTDTGCATTVPIARLQLEYGATGATILPGQFVHFSGTFTNTGKVPFVGISVDVLAPDAADDGLPGVQTATSGTMTVGTSGLTWTGDISVGQTISLTADMQVKDPDPGDKFISARLQSAVPGNNCPAIGFGPECIVEIDVLTPGLTIEETASSLFVIPGDTAIYTLTITNAGNSAYVGAVVTASLLGVVDDADYNPGPTTQTSGVVSFANPNLTWTGDLGIGAIVVVTYEVTAHMPATGDKVMSTRLSSGEAGSSCTPGNAVLACQNTVAVLTPALTVVTSANVGSTVPGATVVFTTTITNSGQTAYVAAAVSASLAGIIDDADYVSSSADSGAVVLGGGGTAVNWTGDLAIGAVATITVTVAVNDPAAGNHLLVQSVLSATQGNNCPSGSSDTRCSTSVPVASLSIVNSAAPATTTPTEVVRLTVVVTNTGQVPYVGITVSDSLAGSLDDAVGNGDSTATSGSVALVPATFSVDWTGDLAPGASVTITGSMTVRNPDPGDKIMTTRMSTTAPASNCPVGGTDPVCATSATVLIPVLTITKVADTTTVTPGGTVGYTITVHNSGPTPYIAAHISDPLAGVLNDGKYLDNAVADQLGTIGYTDTVLTWTGDLDIDQTVIITFSVQVDNPNLGDNSLVNTVISDEIGSTCPTGGSEPACTTTVAVVVPALDISVIANSTTTTPGATVVYTVTIHNIGQTDYFGASVTTALGGVLDDAIYGGNATATAGVVADFVSPNIVWSGDLATEESAVITYSVTVLDPDTGSKTLTTTVSSAEPGSTCGAAAQCSNTVTVQIPGLAVSTTANVATATPGDQVIFTILISNTGQTPYVGTTVTTALDAVTDDATFDGAVTASLGVASYTAPNLTWTGSLPVGASATVSYRVIIRNPDPGNKSLTTTVVAAAAGSSCKVGSSDPGCTATVLVKVPALTIRQTADVATTTPGGVVHYTVTITNSGQTPYVGAVVTNSFSGVATDAIYNGNATVTGGGVLVINGVLATWTGDLLVGAVVTITYSITVNDPDNGDKLIDNSISSTEPGSTCLPGSSLPDCSTNVRVLVPGLQITKTADRVTVVAGSPVAYTITITNTGETAYAPATVTDSLAGVLDDATLIGNAVASVGTVGLAAGTLVWTGSLAIGATATVTYSVSTNLPVTGDKLLANAAISESPGSTCILGTDSGCSTLVMMLVPSLTITKTADSTAVVTGGVIKYTVTATNTGESDYPAAAFSDSLAGITDETGDLLSATATSGSVSLANDILSWDGPLPIGAIVVVIYTVEVDLASTGDTTFVNVVVSTTPGNNCPTTGTDPQCETSTTILEQTLTLTGLTPSFTLSGLPNTTVTAQGAVGMTVTTNSAGGYIVTVRATTPTLLPAASGNQDSIPINLLSVRDSGTVPFSPLSSSLPFAVHNQNTPTGPDGFAVSNDFQVAIPFVAADTYTTTLEYIVTAQ